MKNYLSEEELIEYVKPYLKSRGFKKKNKRWIKDIGEFTISFYIQGSCYDKKVYYVRPGIFVNDLMPTDLVYGHWDTQIVQTTPEEILQKFELWCEEWTDKSLIKKRLADFIEWEEQNPIEKRCEELVDYESKPNPVQEFFVVDEITKRYILENF